MTTAVHRSSGREGLVALISPVEIKSFLFHVDFDGGLYLKSVRKLNGF